MQSFTWGGFVEQDNRRLFFSFLPDTIRDALMPVRAWERSDTPQRSEDSESLAIYRENPPALLSRFFFGIDFSVSDSYVRNNVASGIVM